MVLLVNDTVELNDFSSFFLTRAADNREIPYASVCHMPMYPLEPLEKHRETYEKHDSHSSDQIYPWIQHLHICICVNSCHLNLWVSTWVGDQGGWSLLASWSKQTQESRKRCPGDSTVPFVQLVFRARCDRCEMVTRHNLFLLWVRGWQSLMLPDATLDVPRTATILEAHSRDGWQKKTWWKQIIYIFVLDLSWFCKSPVSSAMAGSYFAFVWSLSENMCSWVHFAWSRHMENLSQTWFRGRQEHSVQNQIMAMRWCQWLLRLASSS